MPAAQRRHGNMRHGRYECLESHFYLPYPGSARASYPFCFFVAVLLGIQSLRQGMVGAFLFPLIYHHQELDDVDEERCKSSQTCFNPSFHVALILSFYLQPPLKPFRNTFLGVNALPLGPYLYQPRYFLSSTNSLTPRDVKVPYKYVQWTRLGQRKKDVGVFLLPSVTRTLGGSGD